MVKAHALYFTLVISVLIALICSSLILAGHYHNVLSLHERQEKKLVNNLESGIAYLLSESDELNETVDLFGESIDSVKLKSSYWGVFDYGSVISQRGKSKLIKSFLYGFYPKDKKTALYVSDLDRPLMLCGNTKLKGICYVPKAGVKRGNVSSRNYIGTKLIYGKQEISTHKLPNLNEDRLTHILSLLNNGQSNTFESLQDTFRTDYTHSFSDTTGLLQVDQINSRFLLKGKIIIISKNDLTISRKNKLEDVVIIAPVIHIESGFEGNAQFFATDSIYVEDNCYLKYPSVLGLLKRETNTEHAFISIGKNTKIEGIVFSHQPKHDKYKTLIQIDERVLIHGHVYAHGFLELKGTVYGNVICNKFRLYTPSTLYENYLLDTEIDISKRSRYFVSSSLLETETKKEVIKWLE